MAFLRLFYGEGAQGSSTWFSGYTNADMKSIWQTTGRDCRKGGYMHNGQMVSLQPYLDQCIKKTFKVSPSVWRWFAELFTGKTYKSQGHDTRIQVISKDALELAISFKKQGLKTALLNPANAYTPGGGYLYGARAMEEDLCRRSGLAFAIDKKHMGWWNYLRTMGNYPLWGSSLLYNPDVPIFRKGREGAYAYLPAPVTISMITSAAIDLNHGKHNYRQNPEAFAKETERRIYAQLSVAADQGNEAVVLTAFGCGAFHNPPELVAKLYKKVIDSHFHGVFKNIAFAVINDHNSGQAHNPEGNFKPFKRILDPGLFTRLFSKNN